MDLANAALIDSREQNVKGESGESQPSLKNPNWERGKS